MMNVKVISRIPQVQQRLAISPTQRMYEAVSVIRGQTLITLSGNRSGRTYLVPGTHKTYTASAPGEAPAQATGELREHVSTSVETKATNVLGKVGIPESAKNKITGLSIGDYAICLEYGTTNMAARPWLLPSFNKVKGQVKSILGAKWL